MRVPLASLALLCLTACSSGYKNETLKLELKPPSGSSVDSETPDSVAFTGGLEIISVPAVLPKVGDVPLNDLADRALAGAKRTMPGKIISASPGDLGGARAARFEWKSDDERGLLYVLPRSNRFIVVRFVGKGSDYGQRESKVERALGTLKLTD